MTLFASVESTGVVFLNNSVEEVFAPLPLILNDDFKDKEFPVRQRNGHLAIAFPFGDYNLSKRELDSVMF